jgi:hypothetical protein
LEGINQVESGDYGVMGCWGELYCMDAWMHGCPNDIDGSSFIRLELWLYNEKNLIPKNKTFGWLIFEYVCDKINFLVIRSETKPGILVKTGVVVPFRVNFQYLITKRWRSYG